MDRQCAWCLRIIDSVGTRISPLPLPKRYEATHGICVVCGARWIEQALQAQNARVIALEGKNIDDTEEFALKVPSRSFTERTLHLQTTDEVPAVQAVNESLPVL